MPRQTLNLGILAHVDAADFVDDTGGVQEPFGQSGLTGVDVRQDAQVERSSRHSVIPLEVTETFVLDMNAWRISPPSALYAAQLRRCRTGGQANFPRHR